MVDAQRNERHRRRPRQCRRDENRSVEALAERGEAGDLVRRRPDDGKIEPLFDADVAVADVADMQGDADGERRPGGLPARGVQSGETDEGFLCRRRGCGDGGCIGRAIFDRPIARTDGKDGETASPMKLWIWPPQSTTAPAVQSK